MGEEVQENVKTVIFHSNPHSKNCKGCKSCPHATSCTNCTSCAHATSCTNCTSCPHSTSCTNCTSCPHCTSCTSCISCAHCKECQSCIGCKGSYGLIRCENIGNWTRVCKCPVGLTNTYEKNRGGEEKCTKCNAPTVFKTPIKKLGYFQNLEDIKLPKPSRQIKQYADDYNPCNEPFSGGREGGAR